MKLKIDVSENAHTVEIIGNPLQLLLELTICMSKQEEVRHLIKHAVELADMADKEMINGKAYFDSNDRSNGTKIIDKFMERYKKDRFDYNKN